MQRTITSSIRRHSRCFESSFKFHNNFHHHSRTICSLSTRPILIEHIHKAQFVRYNTPTPLRNHNSNRYTNLLSTKASQRPPQLDQEEINKILSELAVPAVGILILITILPFVVATASPVNLLTFVGIASATGYFLAPSYGIDPQAAVITVVGVTVGSLILPFFLQLAFFLFITYFLVNTVVGGLFNNRESSTSSQQDDIFSSFNNNFNGFNNDNVYNSSSSGRKNMSSIDPRDVTIDIEAETIDD